MRRAGVRCGDLVERAEHREAALVEVGLAHARRARAVDVAPVTAVLAGQKAAREREVGHAREPVALAYARQLALVVARSIRL